MPEVKPDSAQTCGLLEALGRSEADIQAELDQLLAERS